MGTAGRTVCESLILGPLVHAAAVTNTGWLPRPTAGGALGAPARIARPPAHLTRIRCARLASYLLLKRSEDSCCSTPVLVARLR